MNGAAVCATHQICGDTDVGAGISRQTVPGDSTTDTVCGTDLDIWIFQLHFMEEDIQIVDDNYCV